MKREREKERGREIERARGRTRARRKGIKSGRALYRFPAATLCALPLRLNLTLFSLSLSLVFLPPTVGCSRDQIN